MKPLQTALVIFLCAVGLVFSMATGATQAAQAVAADQPVVDPSKVPGSKQTALGLYITAFDAYVKWHTAPDTIKILDCRTPEEYVFVGHAPMAINIPGEFLAYQYDGEKKQPVMKDNPNFVEEVKKKLNPADTIFVMCRSGGRSAKCVNSMAGAGFKTVYNVIDGFEGDMVKDPESYFNGKRMKNGWKNSGAPWTYDLDPQLMYLP
jgi:rhodanese-related sulfurtransferase